MKQFAFILFLIPIIAFGQKTSKSVSVNVNENDGKREVKVVAKVNGEKTVYEWTDEGEIPEDIKRQLKEANIDISALESSDGEYIEVTVDGDAEAGEEHKMVIVKEIESGDKDDLVWISEGEMSDDIKKQLEEEGIDIMELEGSEGKQVKVIVDGNEKVVERNVFVIKKGDEDGEVMEFEWDGEGEMPAEMKELLEEHDIDIKDIKGSKEMRHKRMRIHKDEHKKAHHYEKQRGRKMNAKQKDKLHEHENVFVFSDDEHHLSDAYMGVHIESTDNGAKVIEILKDSPADKAGLEKGDVVLKVNGARTRNMDGLLGLLNHFEPNDEVTLTLLRNGSEKDVKMTLGQRPDNFR